MDGTTCGSGPGKHRRRAWQYRIRNNLDIDTAALRTSKRGVILHVQKGHGFALVALGPLNRLPQRKVFAFSMFALACLVRPAPAAAIVQYEQLSLSVVLEGPGC